MLHRIDNMFSEDPSVKHEVSAHVAICREGADLKVLLGIPAEDGPPEYHLSPPQSTMEAVEQGNQVAAQEPAATSIFGSSALPDLAKLIASQGVWAAKVKLPDEMSGMFLRDPSFGMAVLINEKHPLSRRRFFPLLTSTGHALMDRRAPATVTTEKNRKDFVEVRSNAFAAAFLLSGGWRRVVLCAIGEKPFPAGRKKSFTIL